MMYAKTNILHDSSNEGMINYIIIKVNINKKNQLCLICYN